MSQGSIAVFGGLPVGSLPPRRAPRRRDYGSLFIGQSFMQASGHVRVPPGHWGSTWLIPPKLVHRPQRGQAATGKRPLFAAVILAIRSVLVSVLVMVGFQWGGGLWEIDLPTSPRLVGLLSGRGFAVRPLLFNS